MKIGKLDINNVEIKLGHQVFFERGLRKMEGTIEYSEKYGYYIKSFDEECIRINMSIKNIMIMSSIDRNELIIDLSERISNSPIELLSKAKEWRLLKHKLENIELDKKDFNAISNNFNIISLAFKKIGIESFLLES